MRKKKGFSLRQICGENVIIAEGKENIDFCNIVSMNDSSAYLWEAVGSKDFDANTLCQLLTGHYDIDEQTAKADAEELINKWKSINIIEG